MLDPNTTYFMKKRPNFKPSCRDRESILSKQSSLFKICRILNELITLRVCRKDIENPASDVQFTLSFGLRKQLRNFMQVLLSRVSFFGGQGSSNSGNLQNYRKTAEAVMCGLLPKSPSATKSRTDSKLIFPLMLLSNCA